MKTSYLKRFREAFESYDWTTQERRRYARQWAQSVRALGSKWRALPQPTK